MSTVEVSIEEDAFDSFADSHVYEGVTRRLSADQLQKLLDTLAQRFDQSNVCRPEGVTCADVRKILEDDPERAYRVYAAETFLGAEMHYVTLNRQNLFIDLRPELNVEKDVIFLNSIHPKEKESVIISLCGQYPNIPGNAFDRVIEDKRGPNKWEGLLIERVLNLKSMTEADYWELQNKLQPTWWLDRIGASWLEASQEQLARGLAPCGHCYGHGVDVREDLVGFRNAFRGVRVWA